MNLDFIKRRGSSAKTILDNEAYQLAVRRARESLLNEWTMTKAKQTEERERIYILAELCRKQFYEMWDRTIFIPHK